MATNWHTAGIESTNSRQPPIDGILEYTSDGHRLFRNPFMPQFSRASAFTKDDLERVVRQGYKTAQHGGLKLFANRGFYTLWAAQAPLSHEEKLQLVQQAQQAVQAANEGREHFGEELSCICRLPKAGKMVDCETCNEWYHWNCIAFVPDHASGSHDYICPTCKQRGMGAWSSGDQSELQSMHSTGQVRDQPLQAVQGAHLATTGIEEANGPSAWDHNHRKFHLDVCTIPPQPANVIVFPQEHMALVVHLGYIEARDGVLLRLEDCPEGYSVWTGHKTFCNPNDGLTMKPHPANDVHVRSARMQRFTEPHADRHESVVQQSPLQMQQGVSSSFESGDLITDSVRQRTSQTEHGQSSSLESGRPGGRPPPHIEETATSSLGPWHMRYASKCLQHEAAGAGSSCGWGGRIGIKSSAIGRLRLRDETGVLARCTWILSLAEAWTPRRSRAGDTERITRVLSGRR